MDSTYELLLIFIAVIVGVISAAYFYVSVGVFMPLLQKPLRWIAAGVLVIATGILLAAFISYESSRGIELIFYGVPLSAYFYMLYIIGSIMIALGAHKFTHHPKKVVDVALQEVRK